MLLYTRVGVYVQMIWHGGPSFAVGAVLVLHMLVLRDVPSGWSHFISWHLPQANILDSLSLKAWWHHTSEEMPSRHLEIDTFLFPL